jgi:F0F1-type ATP synthase membrane subunit b/b'
LEMNETAYIDELLKAEQEAAEIIENAQKER